MALDNAAVPVTPPSKVRIWKVVVDNGVNQTSHSAPTAPELWLDKPKVSVILMKCDPIVDEDLDPVLNEYGLPTYKDFGEVAQVNITDPTVLTSFLASVWGPLMTAAYDQVDDVIGTLTWNKI